MRANKSKGKLSHKTERQGVRKQDRETINRSENGRKNKRESESTREKAGDNT